MSRVAHVAVVGRDAAAWLAALALRRALGRTGLRVTVVELPPQLHPSRAFSAVPSIGGLHRVLGLDDDQVVRAAKGVPTLGQRFVNWSGNGSAFVHGYDARAASIGEIAFLQYWTMARGQGMQIPFEEFSIAAAAAKQGRVPRPGGEPEALGSLSPGYHFDARAYVEIVGTAALRAGVVHHRTAAVDVERDGDRIAGVVLDDATRIEADLFVDASGAEALLLGSQPGAETEDWSRWLPADRLLVGSAPRLRPLPAFANIAAFQAGWLGMFPLADRTAVVAAFDSALIGPEEMAKTAASVIGAQLTGAAVIGFRAGAQRRAWIGNCVAVGEAAIRLEQLDGVELHLIHLAISHLISLFPVESGDMPEAEAFNTVLSAHARNIRDFQIAHYKLNARTGDRYWDAARDAEVPQDLAHRIATFAARGVVPVYDDETFEVQNWASILIGHGVIPRDYAPHVDHTPREEAIGKFQGFLHAIAEEVKAMPSVEEHLAGAPRAPAPHQPTGLF